MKPIRIRVSSNRTLFALIRGQSVRPAQQHRDRKLEQSRKACRGGKWDE